jgi:hypothetical protein
MRTDGTFTPDFRGVLETDDGAKIFFAWQGYTRAGASGVHEIVGRASPISARTTATDGSTIASSP